MQLVCAVGAKLALLARGCHPLHSGPVADLPYILHVGAHRDYIASSLMASDPARGVGHDSAEGSPFIVQERFVRGTETGPVDLYEDLA